MSEKLILAHQNGITSVAWEIMLCEALINLGAATGYIITITHEKGDIGDKAIISNVYAEKKKT